MQIPEILVVLRDMLYLLNPFSVGGIFRKAGSENEMKQIIKSYQMGLPIRSDNPHTLATLIKVSFTLYTKYSNRLLSVLFVNFSVGLKRYQEKYSHL